MPGYDQTGPRGQGPMTGKRMGNCNNRFPRRFNCRYNEMNQFTSKEDEKEYLEKEVEYLKQNLEEIQSKITKLDSNS